MLNISFLFLPHHDHLDNLRKNITLKIIKLYLSNLNRNPKTGMI